jgi:hypothetical protein
MANSLGKIDNNYPKGKLLKIASMHTFVFSINSYMRACKHPIKNISTVFINSTSMGEKYM